MTEKYADIAEMPHKEPRNRVRMPLLNRAAQFAPFAALTGLDGEMAEKARITEQKRELCEFEQNELNEKLRKLADSLSDGRRPRVRVTYFVRDKKKSGGRYADAVGVLKRADEIFGELVFADIPPIKICDIVNISEE